MTTFANEVHDFQGVDDEHGVMAVMNRDGDAKTIWDRNNPDEVAAAKAMFDALKAKGYAAFSVRDDGEKGAMLHTFDPLAEKIIMAPALQGG